MDKKSKIFFLVFFLLIAGSVAVTYWRIMVKRDYIISAQQECDPAAEACFVSACDPESDSECAATPEEERTTYYKIIQKNAKNIPFCDAQKDECPTELACADGEAECSFELCDETNVPDGEECNDPAVYNEENPPEECDCNGVGDETVTEVEEPDNVERDPNCVCDKSEENSEDSADSGDTSDTE